MTDFKKVEADAKAKVNSTIICKDVPNMFQPSIATRKLSLGVKLLGAVDNWFSSHLTANWLLTLDPLPPSLLMAIRGSFL